MEHLDIARTLVAQMLGREVSDGDAAPTMMDFYPIFEHSWIFDDEIGWKVVLCSQSASELYIVTYSPVERTVFINSYEHTQDLTVEPGRLVI